MKLITTLDSSPTLFVPAFNEYYHSVNGAVTESMHVFIRNGLDYMREKTKHVNILEIGMGTGLNVCLTLKHAGDAEISYTAMEPFPLDETVWKELNYDAWIDRKAFEAVHRVKWSGSHRMTASHPMTFTFKKLQTTLQNFQAPGRRSHQAIGSRQMAEMTEKFDLIYFDAFAPDVQPELWTEAIFSKIFQMTNESGALVTYCAKGSVKRALKASGFAVESLPGAPGKREMVRGVKFR